MGASGSPDAVWERGAACQRERHPLQQKFATTPNVSVAVRAVVKTAVAQTRPSGRNHASQTTRQHLPDVGTDESRNAPWLT